MSLPHEWIAFSFFVFNDVSERYAVCHHYRPQNTYKGRCTYMYVVVVPIVLPRLPFLLDATLCIPLSTDVYALTIFA